MKKIKLDNYEYQKSKLADLDVIIDDEGVIVFIALLYSIHLKRTNEIYLITRRDRREGYKTHFEPSPVSYFSAKSCISCLFRFVRNIALALISTCATRTNVIAA